MSQTPDGWFRCAIDRKTLKQLSQRNDKDAYIRFGIYYGVLISLGTLVILSWGTLWAVVFLLLYSGVWSFANALGHEACHGTPFRTYRLNQALLYVTSWMISWEPITVRWVHARHHTYTSIVADDAEYLVPNVLRWRDLLSLISGWNQAWHYNKELVQLGFGRANHFIRVSVPDSELPEAFHNARIFLASYLLIVAVSIALQSGLPVCLLLLPRVLGAPVHGILRITQHGGLATGVRDHRLTTRSMYVNPLLRFFYCNMNYHVEHHMFPMVPFHSLPQLHQAIKEQMPQPSTGVIGAMSEVLQTMTAQRRDPGYVHRPRFHHDRPLSAAEFNR